jgi:hypothetical protein
MVQSCNRKVSLFDEAASGINENLGTQFPAREVTAIIKINGKISHHTERKA